MRMRGLALGVMLSVAALSQQACSELLGGPEPATDTDAKSGKLAFVIQPVNGTVESMLPAVQVCIQDDTGATQTSATNSISIGIGAGPPGAILSGDSAKTAVQGCVSFSELHMRNGGISYTLVASSTGLAGATSSTFNVVGLAEKLAFTAQPSDAVKGAQITPPVKVTVQDALGQTVLLAQHPITLGIGTNPGGATMSINPFNAFFGVATFEGVTIREAGVGYTLSASAPGLVGAISAPFTIAAFGAPASLVIYGMAGSTSVVGPANLSTVGVEIKDAYFNIVASSNASVTIALAQGSPSAQLAGTLTRQAINGNASFTDLHLGTVGTGYRLVATSAGLPSATSIAFDVRP